MDQPVAAITESATFFWAALHTILWCCTCRNTAHTTTSLTEQISLSFPFGRASGARKWKGHH